MLLGFGTYQMSGEVCIRVTKFAIQCGYRLIDTAQVSMMKKDRNEEQVGIAIRESGVDRSELFITSKMHPKYLKSGVYDSCIESLKKLGLDYLDLFLIHWPGAAKIPSSSPDNAVYRKNTWKEMERLVREGKCKHIGVSNYEIKHLRELLDYAVIPPYLNQFELHPYLYNKELVEFCKQHNIRVQAYSSLGQGDSRLLSHPTVTKIASKLQKTPAQILLRWATQKNILVIPKSITNGRIIENMDCINWEIPEFEMQQLDQFDASIRFCWDPTIVA